MSHKKDIKPRNAKGQQHGLWKEYYDDGSLWFKGVYKNGRRVRYHEWHPPTGYVFKEYWIT